jgi:hypothetical protein
MGQSKVQQQVAAQVDKMQCKLIRVSALSVSLIQSQVLFNESEHAKIAVVDAETSDEVLVWVL